MKKEIKKLIKEHWMLLFGGILGASIRIIGNIFNVSFLNQFIILLLIFIFIVQLFVSYQISEIIDKKTFRLKESCR